MSDFDLIVGPLYAPKRIDAYLVEAFLGEFSRQEIQAAIKQNKIYLREKPAQSKTLVKEGDKIHGELLCKPPSLLIAEKIPLNVIYEEDDFLVVDKPAGMVVHPGAGNKKGTLAQALLARDTPLSDMGGKERPGIVHRLDKDTSGLLVIAKNNRTHRDLQRQFMERQVAKTYLALVHGKLRFEEGQIKAYMGRDSKDRTKKSIVSTENAGGKLSQTHYRVMERFAKSTLLEVKILTGRTHQIRVHMAHLKHPIFGDKLYGLKDEYKRLGLHAKHLEFSHPKSGKLISFESPAPQDLQEMIDNERLKAKDLS